MKKFFKSLFMVALAMCMFVMVGCSNDEATETPVEPDTPEVKPDDKPEEKPEEEKPEDKPVVAEKLEFALTPESLDIVNKKYGDGEVTINNIKFAYYQLCNHDAGIQSRLKDSKDETKKPSHITNVDAIEKGIKEIKIVLHEGKAGFANEGALKIELGNEAGKVEETLMLNTEKDVLEYSLKPVGNYKFVTITHNMKYSFYADSYTIVTEK